MPVFNDSENKTFVLLPEGDYQLTCTECEIGIQSGGKTAGSETYRLTFEASDGKGKCSTVKELLIDHATCAWKIDIFCKACGVKLAKGQAFSFRKDEADRNKWTWVDPLGLRCTAKLIVEQFTTKDGRKLETNRVAVFYTDRPLLERVKVAEDEDKPF